MGFSCFRWGCVQFKIHGCFIAVGVFGAVNAVGPNLLRQNALVHDAEPQAGEKRLLIGQREHLSYAQVIAFAEAWFRQKWQAWNPSG